MANKHAFQHDARSIELLQIIESNEDQVERLKAIDLLAQAKTEDSARILQETFERTNWRHTKFAILKALGLSQGDRAVEFLCKIASNTEDLPMASEAILALGCTDSAIAGEFLTSVILFPHHPLIRESLIAIANLNWFPCDDLIHSIVSMPFDKVPTAVLQNAIIGAGIRRQTELLPQIEDFVIHPKQAANPAIFNTSMIALGRIGTRDTLNKLEKLDTRFRAFANQLKISAMEGIRAQLKFTVEDAISEILKSESPSLRRQSILMLKSFPSVLAREAFDIFAQEASKDLQALVKCATANTQSLDADWEFLVQNSESLSTNVFAALGRTLIKLNKRQTLDKIGKCTNLKFKIRFYGNIYTPASELDLFELLDSTQSVDIKQLAINSLVALPMMQVNAEAVLTKIGKKLVPIIEQENNEILKARMIRALGQLRYSGPDFMNLLRSEIKSGGSIQPSVYAALALQDSDDSAKIVIKRFKQIVSLPECLEETKRAIETLARFNRLPELPELANVSSDLANRLKIPMLKILSTVKLEKFNNLIESALKNGDFQQKILSVAAAKENLTTGISSELFLLINHADECLRGRALHTLLTAGSLDTHLQLLNWLKDGANDVTAHLNVYKTLTPAKGVNYNPFVESLTTFIASKPAVFSNPEVLQAAMNLRDNILDQNVNDDSKQALLSSKKLSPKEQHEIDSTLVRDLNGFATYSETIKSVLRSGEVICQHPELFDARVDKSTVLIQYVKSIDLLLQERVGAALFLQPGSDLLQKMQSRLVRLELDDDQGFGSKLVTDLQVSMYFSRETFPAHKLASICRFIMTGQLMRDQYKAIDGLRAWALLLLLFSRTFKFRDVPIEPLFPMAKSQNEGICAIARDMNELQEARNRAAHRGTMLEMGNMQGMRQLCSSVLNSLNEHLVKK